MPQLKTNTEADFMNLKEEIKTLTEEANKETLGGEINIWVPLEHREKYFALQAKTKKKFTRLLRKMMLQTIDEAYNQLVV